MQFCTQCGKPVNGAFCTNCGTPVREAAKPAAPITPPPAATPTAPKPASTNNFFSSAGSLDGSAPKVTPIGTPSKPVAPKASAAVPVTPPAATKPVTPPPATAAPVPPRTVPVMDSEPAPAPMPRRTHRRISVGKELKLLLRQGFLVLVGERRNLIISLMFPILAAIVTVWIAGEFMFLTNEGTKSACFVLVCAAIWGGLFNSIQTIVKERSNIKRDYVSGALRIECYMGSRAIIQLILCLIQSFILALSVPMAEMFWEEVEVPAAGLFGLPIFLEFFFTLFLIMLASDALGLLLSSFVKKEEVASKLAPYVLIAQLLFSGFLFTIEDDSPAILLSYLMISRWGIGALGSICDLNNLPRVDYLDCLEKNESAALCSCGTLEEIHYPPEDSLYTATSGHLIGVFLIMLLFVVVSLVAADFLLHKVKKDGRE